MPDFQTWRVLVFCLTFAYNLCLIFRVDLLKVLAVLVAVWLLKFLGGTHLTYNKSMFKKTIAVLLVFSIVLSSCGKKDKDKSNDFVRATPVESQESFESSDPSETRETRDSVKSLTLFEPLEARVSAACDRFDSCRYVRGSTFWRYYYTYDMFHIYDVSVTPNRVVCAVVGLYVVCKLPIFRWKRTLFGQRNFATEYGELARRSQGIYDGNNSIFDWLHRRWRSVFKHKHKSPHERSLGLPPYSFTSCSSTSSSISPTPQLLSSTDFK